MLRFGIISDFDPEKWVARVKFDEDQMISDWLPIMVRGSKNIKDEFPMDLDEQVACMMDGRDEQGVILGTVYFEGVSPQAKSKDIFTIKFADGLVETYDRSAKKKNWVIGDVELVLTETGFTVKKSTNSLRKILGDLIDQIKLITVTTPNGPSGTPINATAFDPIKENVNDLFEA